MSASVHVASQPSKRRFRRIRCGFTVVEVVVAMLVFAVGVLGMASTAAQITTQAASTRQQTLAAMTAQSRFESLRSRPCTSITAGSAASRGIIDVWTKRDTTRLVIVTDTVKWTVRGVQKKQAFRSAIPCLTNP